MGGRARLPLIPLTAESTIITAAAGTAAALGAVAVYSPKAAVFALLAGAFVWVAMSRLPLALAAFLLLTFPEDLPGSFGAGATLAKPVGALTVIAWAGIVLTRGGALPLLPRERPLLFWTIVAFVLFGTVSVLWAPAAGPTWSSLGRLLLVVTLAVVTYTAASARSGFRTIVYGYLLASVVTSLYSISSGTYLGKGRLAGLFDPNFFAAELIPPILIAFFLLVTTSSRRVRLFAAIVAVMDLVAFALTQSRGGIIGLAVALLVAVVLAGRARPRVLALVLVVVAVGLGYYLTYRPAHVFESGASAGGLATASSGRTDEWRVALRVVAGHPIGGVGLGNYRVVEPSYATQTLNLNFARYIVTFRQLVHNMYLQTAAELGFVGLALFLAILVLPLRQSGRALKRLEQAGDDLEFHARGLVAGAIGMLVAYVFLSAELEKPLWFVLGLLAAVPALVPDEAVEEGARAEDRVPGSAPDRFDTQG
jgi:O-antigen ligase